MSLENGLYKNGKCSSALSSQNSHASFIQQLDHNNCGDCLEKHDEPIYHYKCEFLTTLRNELEEVAYQKRRLETELSDIKNVLTAKNSECVKLRDQITKQKVLVSSLQDRLNSAESREKSIQLRFESKMHVIQHEKQLSDEHCKELLSKVHHLEARQANEESKSKMVKNRMRHFVQRLRTCLFIEDSESEDLLPNCILNRIEEFMTEMQQTKNNLASAYDKLRNCENELMQFKSFSNVEKQHLSDELERIRQRVHELEAQCEQYERDILSQKDKTVEAVLNSEQLQNEIKMLESRYSHLQDTLNSVQNDRLQFLRYLAQQLNIMEPCETLIKHKLKEVVNENRNIIKDIQTPPMKISSKEDKPEEPQQLTKCCLKKEGHIKCKLANKLEKCFYELQNVRQSHLGLSNYLHRLAKALNYSGVCLPPATGIDTNILAESLLKRAKCFASLHQNEKPKSCRLYERSRSPSTPCYDLCHQSSIHTVHTKLRKEKSSHDILRTPSTCLCDLQRKVKTLEEHMQRQDHIVELLKQKLIITESNARRKCSLQKGHNDSKSESSNLKQSSKMTDSLSQLAKVRAQFAESVDYKILALEKAREIDELAIKICTLEEEKACLSSQLNALKECLKTSDESLQNTHDRNDTLIKSLRENLAIVQAQLNDTKIRTSELQAFYRAVVHILHQSDLSERTLIKRLQALCSVHKDINIMPMPDEKNSSLAKHTCVHNVESPTHTKCSPKYSSLAPHNEAHCS